MSKYLKLIEDKEDIIASDDKMSIWVCNDKSENGFKFFKIYDKSPILYEDAIPAYIDLLSARYLPIKRKKQRFLSNDEINIFIEIMNKKDIYGCYKDIDNYYHKSLQQYNELLDYFQEDIILGNWYIPECLPTDLPLPDYSKLKDYNK